MKKGLFIVFEGIDGCGKTTQVKLLAERLVELGHEIIVTREPGGTRMGREIRRLLLNPAHKDITPQAEALLYAADRAQHVGETIYPAVKAGKIVICDRFIDSTLAYQGGGRGMSIDFLKQLNGLAAGGVTPDLVIILDVLPEVGMSRIRGGERAIPDRLESEDLYFYQRVRETYLTLARQSADCYRVIKGEMAVDRVQREVWKQVEGLPGVAF